MKVYDRAALEKVVGKLPDQFTKWSDPAGLLWMGDVGEL